MTVRLSLLLLQLRSAKFIPIIGIENNDLDFLNTSRNIASTLLLTYQLHLFTLFHLLYHWSIDSSVYSTYSVHSTIDLLNPCQGGVVRGESNHTRGGGEVRFFAITCGYLGTYRCIKHLNNLLTYAPSTQVPCLLSLLLADLLNLLLLGSLDIGIEIQFITDLLPSSSSIVYSLGYLLLCLVTAQWEQGGEQKHRSMDL